LVYGSWPISFAEFIFSPYSILFWHVFAYVVRLPGVAKLCAALGVHANVAHATMTLETLFMIRGLQTGHGSVVAIKSAVAVFAWHKALGDRILECIRGDLMTLLAWQRITYAVLVMAGRATARDGNMLRVIELYRGVGVPDAVQDAHTRRSRRSDELRRGEKAKAYD
jgi:hypothetical protein